MKFYLYGEDKENEYYHRSGMNYIKNIINENIIDNNSDILFIPNIDKSILWSYDNYINNIKNPEKNKWIGILHITNTKLIFNPNIKLDIIELLDDKNSNFYKCYKNCKGIYVFSNYLKIILDNYFFKNNINIKINILHHPIDFNVKQFNYENFLNNNNKKLIQIGQQLRVYSHIYRINTDYEKIWLPGISTILAKKLLKKERDYFNLNIDTESIKRLKLNNDEYDEILIKNIVTINLYDSSANNTLIECIVRNVPIIINKCEAVVEYLGEYYPLYFNTINDIENILKDNILIYKGYDYLRRLDKDFLKKETFIKKMIESEIILNLK
tara:strand:- start:1 stop:978 length:978 start_codon:yes stop_codon:yes gene_type:complete